MIMNIRPQQLAAIGPLCCYLCGCVGGCPHLHNCAMFWLKAAQHSTLQLGGGRQTV